MHNTLADHMRLLSQRHSFQITAFEIRLVATKVLPAILALSETHEATVSLMRAEGIKLRPTLRSRKKIRSTSNQKYGRDRAYQV